MPPPKADAPKLSVVSPSLPAHRSESIAQLTARARSLAEESRLNQRKIDELTNRNHVIQRSLTEISKQVIEHAWDGQPIY